VTALNGHYSLDEDLSYHEEPHSNHAPDRAASASVEQAEVVREKGVFPGRLKDGHKTDNTDELEVALCWQSVCWTGIAGWR
jgi:hypothetical protein